MNMEEVERGVSQPRLFIFHTSRCNDSVHPLLFSANIRLPFHPLLTFTPVSLSVARVNVVETVPAINTRATGAITGEKKGLWRRGEERNSLREEREENKRVLSRRRNGNFISYAIVSQLAEL